MAKKEKKPAEKKRKKKKGDEERELLLQETRNLLKHWTHIRDYLLMAFKNDEINRDQEQSFLETKSETARSQRVVSRKIPEDLQFGADKITDFLRQAISVSHLRGLPVPDKRGLVGSWHYASVMLHRAVGALEYVNEMQQDFVSAKKKMRGIRAIKSEAAATAKKSIVPAIIGVIVIAAVAGALWYFLFGPGKT